MPTQLDKHIDRITRAVTEPGQMFELTEVTRRGVTMPAFKNAPPSVAHYFAHFCNEEGRAVHRRWRDAADLRRSVGRGLACRAQPRDRARDRQGRPGRHCRAQFGQLDHRLYGHPDGERLRHAAQRLVDRRGTGLRNRPVRVQAGTRRCTARRTARWGQTWRQGRRVRPRRSVRRARPHLGGGEYRDGHARSARSRRSCHHPIPPDRPAIPRAPTRIISASCRAR